MYANLCPETIGISGLSADQLIDLAADAGFGGVDLPLGQCRSVDDAHRLRNRAAARGLRWGLFWMPADFPTADDATAAAGIARLREVLPIVQAAGCTRTYNHVWPGSNERAYDEQFEWTVRRLRPVAQLLNEHGVQYGLEFIGPRHLRDGRRHPFVHRLDQAIDLADAVGHGAGVVFDFYHWYTSGGTLDDARARLTRAGGGGRIANVHANDAPRGREREAQLDGERELPLATGVIDAAGAVAMLREVGYDGPVIAEPFEPNRSRLGKLLPRDAATEVAAVLRRTLS